MRHWIHYLLTTAWGFATPVLMGWGSQEIIEFFTSGKERLGHSTPVEFFMLFIVIGGLCLGAFLVVDLLSAAMFLPENGKRTRHFFLALLLYFAVCVGGWLVLALVETGIRSAFS